MMEKLKALEFYFPNLRPEDVENVPCGIGKRRDILCVAEHVHEDSMTGRLLNHPS